MNDAIKFTERIHDIVSNSVNVCKIVIIASVAICLGSAYFAYSFVEKQRDQIYVLDQGAVLSAFRSDNGVQKDLEIMNHLYRFHEIFFNTPPNMELIEKNTTQAMELSDRSVLDYYRDLREKQFYTRLISTNSTMQIVVDSVKTNITSYPYPAKTFATIYILRESTITRYRFVSECQITESVRTSKNPHGLLIEKYLVSDFTEEETRTRK